MNRSTLARRYAPLVALAAIQLLIIAVVPSKAPSQQEVAALSGAPPGLDNSGTSAGSQTVDTTGEAGAAPAVGGTGASGATPGVSGGSSGASGGGGGAASTGTGRATAGPTAGAPKAGGGTATQAAAGDTKHCVGGRQFNPAEFPYAPKCFPKFTGDNKGATYRGVTKDSIKFIFYRANLGQAVDALLTAQGSNPTEAQSQALMESAAQYVNSHYELYGRKLVFKQIKGQCPSVPPDYPCLRNEFRQIIQSENPFAVIWNTSLASPAFDEMSKLGVVNLGGWGFRDSFNQQHAPYHYDLQMGGSQLVKQVGDWWCKRMNGGNARFAGDVTIQNGKRVLGVISTDDPENKLSISELKGWLAKCGASVAHEYYYAQDITTADQQRRAAVAEMRKGPQATTIMCFCDLVAPIFLYNTCEEQKYYPEHVMVATGFMDADRAAQAYDHTLPPDNVTPAKQFENAFGLAQVPQPDPKDNTTAARVMKAAGKFGSYYESAEADFEYVAMLGTLIQGAGPQLTPVNIAKGAAGLGVVGGTTNDKVNQRSFNPVGGDYTWDDALREVYWSPTKPSPFNAKPGRYLNVNGNRWFLPGQFPTGQLNLPNKPR